MAVSGTTVAAPEAEVASLGDRLETRKLVERAKGVLQQRYGLTEPQAFRCIQKAAMDRRLTMRRSPGRVIKEFGEPGAP